jgi:uncharacterized alpha-E superfamily protein
MTEGSQLLSRVADHLYWLSRYLERAEHTARLLEISVTLAPDRTPESASRQGVRLLSALQALDAQRAGLVEFSLLAVDLTVGEREESLLSCVSHARENARQVREQISVDMWEELNRLYLRLVAAREDRGWQEQPEDLFREVRHSVYLFKGMTSSTMVRGEGWQYMELARFLERSINLSMLLDVHLREFHDGLRGQVETVDFVEWLSLLRCCASFDAYVRAHTASIRPLHVLDFLVLNAEFPRSLRFAAERIEESLKRLSRLSGRSAPARVERLAGLLRASLQFVQIEELLHGDILQTLEHVRRQCRLIHHATYQSYISYQLEGEIA